MKQKEKEIIELKEMLKEARNNLSQKGYESVHTHRQIRWVRLQIQALEQARVSQDQLRHIADHIYMQIREIIIL